ncbi:hypothetical protein NLI96_g9002 [Meripilus lineatus]|uniref:Uncharacterized protein n=1 Tax=Meripilus lineatus TaxID=2056292 RepID=A0AAD5YAN4_9APHY|nr:hypothetical protein NLI96_g9002 [Physisporinus lineatus]
MSISHPITQTPIATQATQVASYSQGSATSLAFNVASGPTSNVSEPSGSPFLPSEGTQLSLIRISAIAVGSVTAGCLCFVLVANAAAHSAHFQYVIAFLASSLFGSVSFHCRKIIFVCEDPDLPELQISLFLAIKAAHAIENTSEESDGNQHLVWKAFSIGGNTKSFDVTISTCTGNSKQAGQPKIGFGTIDDNVSDQRVRPRNWELAPARLLEDGTWERKDEETNLENQFIAENTTGRAHRIAIGVAEKPEDLETRSFSPFLVINSQMFGPKANFEVKSDIFLHAFRTGGCKAGDYGDPVMEARKLDKLTIASGHRVKDLGPVTTFYVTCSRKTGKVQLKIGRNRPEDVKKFQLEYGFNFWFCKRGEAKKKGVRDTLILPL